MDLKEAFSKLVCLKSVKNESEYFMAIKKLQYLFIFLLCFAIISCVNSNKEKTQDPLDEYLSVCKIKENIAQYDNKIIKVEALIKGFHELVLYDNNCPDENFIIKLKLDEITYEQLLKFTKEKKIQKSEFTGKIFILGKLEKNAGKLLYYKPVIVDTKNQSGTNTVKNEVLIVDQISAFQIERFDPITD